MILYIVKVCITIDFQSLEDGTVTLRDRDSTLQERIALDAAVVKFQPRAM